METIFAPLLRIMETTAPTLVCIDGQSGAGKSTLAAYLARQFPARVLHTDDYYDPHGRALLDFYRFVTEIARPVAQNAPVHTRFFDCKTGTLSAARTLPFLPVTIVEGAFCLHPKARLSPQIRVFLKADKRVRLDRVVARGGDREAFSRLWMPREEAYFAAFSLPGEGDLVFDTTKLSRI